MTLYTPPRSQSEITAFVTDGSDGPDLGLSNEKHLMSLAPNATQKNDANPASNKAGSKKRGGTFSGTAKATESTFSSLLQPILALFPPTQSASPLAPAFELKSPNTAKGETGKHDAIPLVKGKVLTCADDEGPFVIYQPASWTTKRTKPTAARIARTFDWKTDVFGPSPNAVHGQRTKYPKYPMAPRSWREAGPPRQHFVPLENVARNRAGSVTSASDVSSISFASTGEDDTGTHVLTPLNEQALSGAVPFSRENTGKNATLHEESLAPCFPTTPSGVVTEHFSKMAMASPSDIFVSSQAECDQGAAGMETYAVSMPFTPLSPREVPDSDEESDSE